MKRFLFYLYFVADLANTSISTHQVDKNTVAQDVDIDYSPKARLTHNKLKTTDQ